MSGAAESGTTSSTRNPPQAPTQSDSNSGRDENGQGIVLRKRVLLPNNFFQELIVLPQMMTHQQPEGRGSTQTLLTLISISTEMEEAGGNI